MKKIFACLLLCLMATVSWADEQKKVSLSTDHPKETISLPYCNIFLSLSGEDGEKAKVSIDLENLSETKVFALFDRSYSESAIKRMEPSIRFDKTFGGTKGQRVIEAYDQEMNRVLLLRPSDKEDLPVLTIEGSQVVRLPIYIAKWKNVKENQLILLEKQLIELDIEAATRPSAEYQGLADEVEKMEKTTLCRNSRHTPRLAKQKEDYQKDLDILKARIEQAIQSHGWKEGDKGFQTYTELKDRVEAIDVDERVGDCGDHPVNPNPPVRGHQCNYCGLSLQAIYQQMDNLYKRIYTSSDRQATKQSVIGQVQALYTCCTATNCSKHAAQWRQGGDVKNKIVSLYNRIQGL